MKQILSIGQISKIFSVSPQAVRNWESQGLIKSSRTLKGHRRYNLEEIKNMINNGPENSKDETKVLHITDEEKHELIQRALSSDDGLMALSMTFCSALNQRLKYFSIIRRGCTYISDSPEKYVIGISPEIKIDTLKINSYRILDRLAIKIEKNIKQTEFGQTLNKSNKYISKANPFSNLESLCESLYGFNLTEESVFSVFIRPDDLSKIKNSYPASFTEISDELIRRTGYFGSIEEDGNTIHVYYSRLIPENSFLIRPVSDEVHWSSTNCIITKKDEKLCFTTWEDFEPGSKATLVSF